MTYPDGTTDHVTVPVTTGEKPVADNVTNEPTVKPIEKPHGEATTADDIKGAVDTTGAPEGTTVTVDNPGNLPTGDVPGTVNVPVTVTYPDGTEDHYSASNNRRETSCG